ncbi:MAG TPA: M10 family metallopeptidase C-terminal domain-containing protein, partial [Pirellulaceae bacterium]|nr:M10 family metallopeptidase C-terminal domain-containing protein [Pirellulaceae bacterium]
GVWPPRVTFSFMQDFPDYETGEAVDDPPVWQPFAAQRNGIRQAMLLAEEFMNVDFVEVSDAITDGQGRRGGIMRIGNYFFDNSQSSMLRAFTFAPDDTIENPQGGDMWFNLFWPEVSAGWSPGQISHSIFLTQFGGAIGLQDAGTIAALPTLTRNKQYTVMASDGRPTGGLPAHFQLYDIWALQSLYGANMSTRTGNDTYTVANFLGNNPNGARVIWDAGGNDTISGAGNQPVTIDLRQGSFSSLGGVLNNLAIAFNTNIENAIGSNGNDNLIGNHLDNVLLGGAGNDVLWGNSGDDFLSGGAGNDTYIWKMGDQNLTIDEQAGTGIDVLEIDDSFPTLNSFSQDLAFRRDGLDLLIDIRLERGNTSDGIIRIVNQKWGSWRVETMVFNGVNVDLADVYEKSTSDWGHFSVSNVVGMWGRLVNPA